MTKRPEKTLDTLFQSNNSHLGRLIAQVKAFLGFEQQLKKHLSPELAAHCHIANWRQSCLVIAVDNAAWLTHLRFQKEELLSQLRREEGLHGLRSIEFKVVYPEAKTTLTESQPKKNLHLSTSNAEAIHESAQGISFDPLKKALEKLAQNANKPD